MGLRVGLGVLETKYCYTAVNQMMNTDSCLQQCHNTEISWFVLFKIEFSKFM